MDDVAERSGRAEEVEEEEDWVREESGRRCEGAYGILQATRQPRVSH